MKRATFGSPFFFVHGFRDAVLSYRPVIPRSGRGGGLTSLRDADDPQYKCVGEGNLAQVVVTAGSASVTRFHVDAQ